MGSIGERIKEERKRLELNQTDFASLGGVQRTAQTNYEKGERFPDAAYLASIEKAGADVRYIITGQRDDFSNEERELIGMYRAASLAKKAKALTALTSDGDSAQQTSVGGPQQNVSGGTGNQYNAPVEGGATQHFNGPVGSVAGRDVAIKKQEK